jgi:hypothetical protein
MAQSIRDRLQAVGITQFPNPNSILWYSIRDAVDPPLTISEMIILQNDLFPPQPQG